MDPAETAASIVLLPCSACRAPKYLHSVSCQVGAAMQSHLPAVAFLEQREIADLIKLELLTIKATDDGVVALQQKRSGALLLAG